MFVASSMIQVTKKELDYDSPMFIRIRDSYSIKTKEADK